MIYGGTFLTANFKIFPFGSMINFANLVSKSAVYVNPKITMHSFSKSEDDLNYVSILSCLRDDQDIKGLFTPSVSGSVRGSGSEDYIDLYLCHSHQVAASAALLAAKHQMGSRLIFPVMPLMLYWVSLDFSCNVDVFY